MCSLLGFPSLFFFFPLLRVRKLSKASDHFHKIQKWLLFSDVGAEHSESRLRQPRHGLLQPLNWIKEDTRVNIFSCILLKLFMLLINRVAKEITGKEVERQGMIRTLCRRGEETASVRGWRALPPELLGCPHCAFNAETSSSSANKPNWATTGQEKWHRHVKKSYSSCHGDCIPICKRGAVLYFFFSFLLHNAVCMFVCLT